MLGLFASVNMMMDASEAKAATMPFSLIQASMRSCRVSWLLAWKRQFGCAGALPHVHDTKCRGLFPDHDALFPVRLRWWSRPLQEMIDERITCCKGPPGHRRP